MTAFKARVGHVMSLYAAMVLTATGVFWFRADGWSWKTTVIGIVALFVTYAATWFRDAEFMAFLDEIGDGLRETRKGEEDAKDSSD